MSLRPLRFGRSLSHSDEGLKAGRPSYGSSIYVTSCERFLIHRKGAEWATLGQSAEAAEWLRGTGFDRGRFNTRTEALTALETLLDTEGDDVPGARRERLSNGSKLPWF